MKLGPGFESCPSGVVRPFPTDFWPQCSLPGKWGLALLAPGSRAAPRGDQPGAGIGSCGCNSRPRILTRPAHILILLLLLAFSAQGTRILQPGEKPWWQQGRGRKETVKGARPLPAAERPGDL